jgi:hypothetical protein
VFRTQFKNARLQEGNRTQLSRGEQEEKPEHAVFVKFPEEKTEAAAVAPPCFLEIFAVHRMGIYGDILGKDIFKNENRPLHMVTGSDELD